MGNNRGRRFSDEYKADAVKLWRESGETQQAIADRLGIHATTFGGWIKQLNIDEGNAEGLTTDERQELLRLRKQNKVLQMERDLMKKAAAFFANDETL